MPTNLAVSNDSERPKTTKNITFYKSGDERFKGVQMPVNIRKYRTLDALLDDLSYRVPGLSYGVRRLATSRGKHTITSIDQLSHGANYVCSDKTQSKRVPGVKMSKLPGGENYRFKSQNPPPPPPSPRKKKVKSRSPEKKPRGRRINEKPPTSPENENRPPVKRHRVRNGTDNSLKVEQAKPKPRQRKGRSLTRSRSRDPRDAYSAPGTSHERKRLETNLSPLDKSKLKHEQRRRLASHSVDTDSYTLPSSNSSSTKSNRVAQTKKKKKKPGRRGIVSNVTIEDWQTDEHHQAATTIQRHYRGYSTRKELEEKKKAAVRIQSRYRGYKTRNHLGIQNKPRRPSKEPSRTALAEFSDVSSDAEETESEESEEESEEEASDDETISGVTHNSARTTQMRGDMSEEQAAVKIQSMYRGYKVRKA